MEGNNWYDIVSVQDIAVAFEKVSTLGQNGKRYYIGHRTLKTFREWMNDIKDAVNPNVELLFGTYQDPLNLDYGLIDLDELFLDTGFERTVDFFTGIREHAQWLQQLL